MGVAKFLKAFFPNLKEIKAGARMLEGIGLRRK